MIKKDEIIVPKIVKRDAWHLDSRCHDELKNKLDGRMKHKPFFYRGNPSYLSESWTFVKKGQLYNLQLLVLDEKIRMKAVKIIMKYLTKYFLNMYFEEDCWDMIQEINQLIQKQKDHLENFVIEPFGRRSNGTINEDNTLFCILEFLVRVKIDPNKEI